MRDPDLFSPTLADLIETVRDALENDLSAYERQVARYLLQMSLRELAQGPSLAQHSVERIDALLGTVSESTDGYAGLCASIRAGRFDERLPELLETLIAEAAERVAIVRPDALLREPAR